MDCRCELKCIIGNSMLKNVIQNYSTIEIMRVPIHLYGPPKCGKTLVTNHFIHSINKCDNVIYYNQYNISDFHEQEVNKECIVFDNVNMYPSILVDEISKFIDSRANDTPIFFNSESLTGIPLSIRSRCLDFPIEKCPIDLVIKYISDLHTDIDTTTVQSIAINSNGSIHRCDLLLKQYFLTGGIAYSSKDAVIDLIDTLLTDYPGAQSKLDLWQNTPEDCLYKINNLFLFMYFNMVKKYNMDISLDSKYLDRKRVMELFVKIKTLVESRGDTVSVVLENLISYMYANKNNLSSNFVLYRLHEYLTSKTSSILGGIDKTTKKATRVRRRFVPNFNNEVPDNSVEKVMEESMVDYGFTPGKLNEVEIL